MDCSPKKPSEEEDEGYGNWEDGILEAGYSGWASDEKERGNERFETPVAGVNDANCSTRGFSDKGRKDYWSSQEELKRDSTQTEFYRKDRSSDRGGHQATRKSSQWGAPSNEHGSNYSGQGTRYGEKWHDTQHQSTYNKTSYHRRDNQNKDRSGTHQFQRKERRDSSNSRYSKECFKCRQEGHQARNCPNPPTNRHHNRERRSRSREKRGNNRDREPYSHKDPNKPFIPGAWNTVWGTSDKNENSVPLSTQDSWME